MRGRSSSMEITKVNEAKQEPNLSSAYIRTLVKHLTSKDSNSGLKEFVTQNAECCSSDENKTEKHKHIPKTQPQVHKKQVRRRLHTSKPYQERLLNMAEARREIVTALKFHRASMKQQELATTHNLDTQSPQEKKHTKTRKIQSLYPSSNTTAAATTTTDTNMYSSLSSPPSYWPISTLAPPPPPFSSYHDNQDFILPSQTLGLNLNFQNFDNLDHPNIYHKPLSVYSTSSSSTTSSSTPSSSSSALYTPVEKPNYSSSSGGLHHHAIMDDEEMEEIRSLGQQHQIKWNDTINLVTSARWCSFLKTMEIEAEEGDEYDLLHQFDQNMEFPPWLNDNSCMQHLDEHFSDAYLQDSALPCLAIGEIEAMDGEWLASEED